MSEALQPDFDPNDVDSFDAPTHEDMSARAQMFVLNLQFSGRVSPHTAALLLSNTPDASSPFSRAAKVLSRNHAGLDQSGGPG